MLMQPNLAKFCFLKSQGQGLQTAKLLKLTEHKTWSPIPLVNVYYVEHNLIKNTLLQIKVYAIYISENAKPIIIFSLSQFDFFLNLFFGGTTYTYSEFALVCVMLAMLAGVGMSHEGHDHSESPGSSPGATAGSHGGSAAAGMSPHLFSTTLFASLVFFVVSLNY
ncbi:hypothetical protein Pint_02899 [Pistacia integerrima]|uniref:Uncharacterized protein n=1 Tax=Pistacia integerrima TaxID=434235 RepID=A0ACC0ZDU5_9ROSI|nr:hypothetical protein Pint_02899 [Pistacia integerrima]